MKNIITICGSTKFKDYMFEVAKELTLENKIVLMPLVFAHMGDNITEPQKVSLDILHFQKIDLSSEVHVVMVDNYIGSSTRNEINYAISKIIPVIYHNYIDIREDSSCESYMVKEKSK